MSRHVHVLLGAHAGQRARRHVAHGVAARFARGHVDLRQAAHRAGRFRQRNEVHLYRLARGHMRDAALRITFRHVGNRIQLVRVQTPAGDLDAQHVHAFLALAIYALLQPHRGEAIGIDASLDESLDRLFETVYFFQIG